MYLACRSRARTDEAIADLRKDMVGGAEALFLELDLADLASVRRCASEFLRCGFFRCFGMEADEAS